MRPASRSLFISFWVGIVRISRLTGRWVAIVVAVVLAATGAVDPRLWSRAAAVGVSPVWSGDPAGVSPASAPVAVVPPVVVAAVTAPGPTVVAAGPLTGDTTWGPEGSPYLVSSTVIVPVGVSLTLLPGTVVKLSGRGDGRVVVQGQVLSLGSPAAPVVFTSVNDNSVGGVTGSGSPQPGDWGSVALATPSSGLRAGSVFDYTQFRFGGYATAVMMCQGAGQVDVTSVSAVVVSNSVFSDSYMTNLSVASGAGGVKVWGNTFRNAECGVTVWEGSADVLGNVFESSLDYAFQAMYAKRVRFWYNQVWAVTRAMGTPQPTRASVDVRFNTWHGQQVQVWWPRNQSLVDWGGNFYAGLSWPRDPAPVDAAGAAVFGSCRTDVWVKAYMVPLQTVPDSACGWGQSRVVGYSAEVMASLAYEPGGMPTAVAEASNPVMGPVNTVSGQVSWDATDVSVADAGSTLSAVRSYRSGQSTGDAGTGWFASYGQKFAGPGSTGQVLSLGDGGSLPLPVDPNNNGTVPAPGAGAMSVTTDPGTGGSSVALPDGSSYQFNPDGELVGVQGSDPGRAITVTSSGGAVSGVTGVSGRSLSFHRSGGKLLSVTDSTGRSVVLSYSGDRLVQVTGVDGRVETYGYDAEGRLTSVTVGGVQVLSVGWAGGKAAWYSTPASGKVTLSYGAGETTATFANGDQVVQRFDGSGRVWSETRGRSTTRFVYDGEGRVVSAVLGVPATAMRGYSAVAGLTVTDRAGDVVGQVSPMGQWTTTTFAAHKPQTTTRTDGSTISRSWSGGRMVSMTDPMGRVRSYSYNSVGQVTSITDPLGRVRALEYSAAGDLVKVTDETGAVTSAVVNARGLVSSVTNPSGDTTGYTYTAWDAVASVTQPGGGMSTVSYRGDRQVSSVTVKLTASSTAVTGYSYDAAGRQIGVVDAAGHTWQVGFDQVGRPVTSTTPGGVVTTTTYTVEGWVDTVSRPGSTSVVTRYVHDPAGRALRTIDPVGNTTQTLTDRDGRPVALWAASGGKTSYGYDLLGRLVSVTSPLGFTQKFGWDGYGNQTSETDELGNVTSTTFDALGRPTSQTSPEGNQISFGYSNNDRTTTITDALGVVGSSTVDAQGQTVSTTNDLGGVTSTSYTTDGQVAQVTGPGGGTTSYSYDLAGRLVSLTDPAGRTQTATYNALNQVTAAAVGPHVTGYGFDVDGHVTSVTNPLGQTTSFGYDAAGNQTSVTDPAGGVTTATYDAADQVTSVTDAAGVEVHWKYTPDGQVAVEYDTLGASWVTGWDADGRPVTLTAPDGVVQTTAWTKRGEVDSVKYGSTVLASYTYSKNGNVLTASTPFKHTYSYDVRGRVVSDTNGLSKTTTFGYQTTPAGQSRTTTLPSGIATIVTVDKAGRTTAASNGAGNTSTYLWNPDQTLAKTTLPGGGTYTYTYDPVFGQVATETNPAGAVTTHTVDGLGRPATTSYPSGRAVAFAYTTAGQLASTTATRAPGGPAEVRTYTYDPAGKPLTATSSTGTIATTYNSRGQTATVTTPAGVNSYEWNLAGRLATATGISGKTVSYGYSPTTGQPTTMRGALNADLVYKVNGQPESIQPVAPSAGTRQYWSYDAAGQVTNTSGNSVSYDADGAITQTTDTTNTQTSYTYDNAGRLLTAKAKNTVSGAIVTDDAWTWDADSNRLSHTSTTPTSPGGTGAPHTTTWAYDAAGQITASSAGSYVYDADGALTVTPTTSFGYNAYGEYTSASQTTQPPLTPTTTTVNFGRDAYGRLAARSTAAGTELLGYTGAGPTQTSYQNTAGVAVDLIRTPAGDLAGYASASVGQWIRTNHRGDITTVANDNQTSSGTTFTYATFGAPGTKYGTVTALVPLGYQGNYTDAVTGTVDMGYRGYQPGLGTFQSVDNWAGDLTSPTTLNRYLYANANPPRYTDPTGHSPQFRWHDVDLTAGKKLIHDVGRGATTSTETAASTPSGHDAIAGGIAWYCAQRFGVEACRQGFSAAAQWIGDAHNNFVGFGDEFTTDPGQATGNLLAGASDRVVQGAADLACLGWVCPVVKAVGGPDPAEYVKTQYQKLMTVLGADPNSASYQAGINTTDVVNASSVIVDAPAVVVGAAKVGSKIAAKTTTKIEARAAAKSARAEAKTETKAATSQTKTRPTTETRPQPQTNNSAPQTNATKPPEPKTAPAAANSGRGLGDLGGVISQTGRNSAGGRIFTSSGPINQNDFAGIVNNGLMRDDDVHILTGVHGLPNGSMVADASMYADDVARFGDLPGVTIHDVASMSPEAISGVLQRPGTIIGGFCDSTACLGAFR